MATNIKSTYSRDIYIGSIYAKVHGLYMLVLKVLAPGIFMLGVILLEVLS